MKITVVAAACMITAPVLAYAHNGGLDSNGCHNNKAKNVYECHQGALQGQTFKSKTEAESRLTAADRSTAKPGQQAAKTPEASSTAKPGQQAAKTPEASSTAKPGQQTAKVPEAGGTAKPRQQTAKKPETGGTAAPAKP